MINDRLLTILVLIGLALVATLQYLRERECLSLLRRWAESPSAKLIEHHGPFFESGLTTAGDGVFRIVIQYADGITRCAWARCRLRAWGRSKVDSFWDDEKSVDPGFPVIFKKTE